MSSIKLPPPPNPNSDMNDYSWRDWFRLLQDYLTRLGQFSWQVINFANSSIKDIVDRKHNDLQNIQGGSASQYNHLTNSEYSGTGSGVFVKQTDATLSSPNVDHIDVSITAGSPTHVEGRVFYDVIDHTLAYYNDVSGITVNLGQEQILRVRNATGATITNGSVVYINGATGNRPRVALAKADAEITSNSVIGVATADIANNADGYITVNGLVHDINTSGYTAGDTLWLSPSTAGAFTNVKPTAPNHTVVVGFVTRVNPSVGEILVVVQNGYELDELHDILITGLSDKQILRYDTASLTWKNSDLATPTAGAGLTLKTTQYLSVTIGGVAYKIALVN
jgi:hypothetical protein